MMGMNPADWHTQRPALSPENEIVIAVWNFCCGWNPQALPLALAFYDVRDIDYCLQQLMLMRDKQEARSQLTG